MKNLILLLQQIDDAAFNDLAPALRNQAREASSSREEQS
jgi:hypothetical protein